MLPDCKNYGAMYAAVSAESRLDLILKRYTVELGRRGWNPAQGDPIFPGLEVLEAMLGEGWVVGDIAPAGPFVVFQPTGEGCNVQVGGPSGSSDLARNRSFTVESTDHAAKIRSLGAAADLGDRDLHHLLFLDSEQSVRSNGGWKATNGERHVDGRLRRLLASLVVVVR